MGSKGFLRAQAVGAALALASSAAKAETLYEAIDFAYQSHPELGAQRAAVRVADEGYVQARSQFGPQVSLSGQYGYQIARIDQQTLLTVAPGTQQATTGAADLSIVQPVYTFGRLSAQTDSAAAGVAASRQQLRQTEAQVLQAVITAYMDVRRDRQSLDVVRAEMDTLDRDLTEVRAKGALGQVTRTDVEEAEARWLAARTQFTLYQGRLQVSAAEYLAAVGRNPDELAEEPDLPGVPGTLDEAIDTGEAHNPELLQALEAEKGASADVAAARTANSASVSVRVDLAVGPVVPYDRRDYDRSATAAVVVNKPIFANGLNASRLREALDRRDRAGFEVSLARRNMVQAVSQGWSQLSALRTALLLQQQQLTAERVAAQGNRIEERVGTRQVIDLLNVEQELANARLAVVQGRRDEYVARASLLASLGVLEAEYLTPSAPLYDPAQTLDRVVHKGSVPWTGAMEALDGIGRGGSPKPPVVVVIRPDGGLPLPAAPPKPPV